MDSLWTLFGRKDSLWTESFVSKHLNSIHSVVYTTKCIQKPLEDMRFLFITPIAKDAFVPKNYAPLLDSKQ